MRFFCFAVLTPVPVHPVPPEERMMLTDTLKMILPIVIAFCLGILCRRRLISGEGCQTLKTIVST